MFYFWRNICSVTLSNVAPRIFLLCLKSVNFKWNGGNVSEQNITALINRMYIIYKMHFHDFCMQTIHIVFSSEWEYSKLFSVSDFCCCAHAVAFEELEADIKYKCFAQL